MQKNVRKKHSLFKASVLTLLVVGFITTILFLSQTGEVLVEPVVEREWQRVPMGEINFGGTNSSIVEIYICTLSGAPAYTTNFSNTSGYYITGASHHSHNNTHRSSQVNHSVALIVCAKVRWNQTHALESSNSTWMPQYVNLTIACPGIGISGTVEMDEYNITGQGQGNYIYYNYIYNNSGSGFTLSRGQSIDSSGSVRGMLFNATAYF